MKLSFEQKFALELLLELSKTQEHLELWELIVEFAKGIENVDEDDLQ